MICNRCSAVFSGDACQCGWKPPIAKDLAREWVTFPCAAPDCRTVIRERANDKGPIFCRRCQANGITVKPRTLEPVLATQGEVISKEEFGVELYEIIKKFSEREWLQRQYRVTVTDLRIPPTERRLKLEDLRRREQACTKLITELIPKIASEDARRLIGKYEASACA